MESIVRPSGTIPRSEFGKLVMSQQIQQLQDAVNSQAHTIPNTPAPHRPFGHLIVMAQITNAADGGGIYAARRCYVSDSNVAVFDPSDPAAPADIITDGGDDDLLVINPNEAGASFHLLSDGDYIPVYMTGLSYGELEIAIAIVDTQPKLTPVRITSDGGSAGNKTTQCSFTYTVKDITNTITLATGVAMTGNGQRVVNAAMTAGTYGMAYISGATVTLIWADERITQKNCT